MVLNAGFQSHLLGFYQQNLLQYLRGKVVVFNVIYSQLESWFMVFEQVSWSYQMILAASE